MAKSGAGKGTLVFGLLFAAVGLAVLLFLMLPMAAGALGARGWVATPATVVAADLETNRSSDSTTYRVTAHYRYRFAGSDFEGERVGFSVGADNVGDWHQRWHDELQRARRSGRPITVYVNPDDPSESVVDREVRWGLFGLMAIFPVAFGGFGVGVILLGRRGSDPVPIAPPAAGGGHAVGSGGKTRLVFTWIFAVIWNAVSAPLGVMVPEEVAKGNWPALAGLLFPLVGLGALAFAVRYTLEWRRFGRVELLMDPYPGAIGGDLAGSVDLPLRHARDHVYRAELACLHVYHTGSGKNRSRHEKVLWHDHGQVEAVAAARGTRLYLRFKVPEGLPASEEPSGSYHMWRLQLDGSMPGVDLDRAFEVPMTPGTAQSAALAGHGYTPDNGPPPVPPKSLVRIDRAADGTVFHYPAGRNGGLALFLLAFGSFFVGLPLLIGAPWHMSAIFGAVGGAVLLFGLWLPFNALIVTASTRGLRVERRWLGVPLFSRRAPREAITAIDHERGMQSSKGGRVTVYYNLIARTRDGRKLTVGEGFTSQRLAKEIVGKVASALDLKGSAAERKPPHATQEPPDDPNFLDEKVGP